MSEEIFKEIEQSITENRKWAVDHLAKMTSYGSELGKEQPAQEYVAGIFEEIGLETSLQKIDVDKIKSLPGFSPVDWTYDGRTNVIGRYEPTSLENARNSLVFNGHIDVVSPEPVSLWKTPPFEPVVFNDDDGEWMRGRGAGDMKAGSVCYMWALKALQDAGYTSSSPIICQSVIEEECTGNGALAACADGYVGDACIIPEPFNQTVLRRQVGVMWFQVRILGKTTHVLGAGTGVNAIEKSWVVIQALRELEVEINRSENIPASYKDVTHPINLNVGIISGGDWASTVAGECVTRFRLGLFPGERLEELRARIEKTVADAAANDPWLKNFPPIVEYVGFQAEGYEFTHGGNFSEQLYASHKECMKSEAKDLIATCTTDARFFELYYNTPATCYGPWAKDIHGVDECVNIESMVNVTKVMAHFIKEWCGIEKRKK